MRKLINPILVLATVLLGLLTFSVNPAHAAPTARFTEINTNLYGTAAITGSLCDRIWGANLTSGAGDTFASETVTSLRTGNKLFDTFNGITQPPGIASRTNTEWEADFDSVDFVEGPNDVLTWYVTVGSSASPTASNTTELSVTAFCDKTATHDAQGAVLPGVTATAAAGVSGLKVLNTCTGAYGTCPKTAREWQAKAMTAPTFTRSGANALISGTQCFLGKVTGTLKDARGVTTTVDGTLKFPQMGTAEATPAMPKIWKAPLTASLTCGAGTPAAQTVSTPLPNNSTVCQPERLTLEEVWVMIIKFVDFVKPQHFSTGQKFILAVMEETVYKRHPCGGLLP